MTTKMPKKQKPNRRTAKSMQARARAKQIYGELLKASGVKPLDRIVMECLEEEGLTYTLATVGQWRKADQWDEGADLITGKSLSPIILSYATHPRQALSLEVLGRRSGSRSRPAPDAGPLTPRRAEWPSLRLLTERPDHLVPAPFQSWNEVMDALYDRVAERVRNEAGGDLSQFTWGRRNHSDIHHPLARGLPAIGLVTDPPDVPIPGDTLLPRVGAPGYGSTERFVVSPGHEGDGIFEMPVGEASNPLSPYFLAGHSDWLEGRASPFMPESPRWTLVLKPGKAQ